MQAFEAQNLSTKAFYAQLQDWLGDKILVDKTPSYAYHLNILQRAETQFFENACYIHLLRHPYGAVRSFEDAKLDRLVPFMRSDVFTRREYAELAWLVCQQNIVNFLCQVPPERQHQVKFEDLVMTPRQTVDRLCQFLHLEFHPDMLEPYKEKTQRMTDGMQKISQTSGDLKFHLHDRIEPEAADRWQKFHAGDFLGEITWDLAASFGYDRAQP
jgi:Sulfotransferase family